MIRLKDGAYCPFFSPFFLSRVFSLGLQEEDFLEEEMWISTLGQVVGDLLLSHKPSCAGQSSQKPFTKRGFVPPLKKLFTRGIGRSSRTLDSRNKFSFLEVCLLFFRKEVLAGDQATATFTRPYFFALVLEEKAASPSFSVLFFFLARRLTRVRGFDWPRPGGLPAFFSASMACGFLRLLRS